MQKRDDHPDPKNEFPGKRQAKREAYKPDEPRRYKKIHDHDPEPDENNS